MSEADLQRRVQAQVCKDPNIRLWRNQVGAAWAGRRYDMLLNGDVTVHQPYRVTFGLAVGSADLIGLRQITVTQDMVGQQLAVFASLEIKQPGKQEQAPQRAWRQMVLSLGGIAGVAHSVDEGLSVFYD